MNDVTNVDVFQVAAWDDATILVLENMDRRLDGGGFRTVDMGEYSEEPSRDSLVPAVRLDAYEPIIEALAQEGRLDLIKLDVEGADIHALKGMAGLLEKYHPILLIECHDLYGYYERSELEQTLTDLGYVFEVAATVGSNWQPGVGKIDEIRDADYLVASPAKVTADD
jgi:FkbM family methyltransferase